MILEAEQPVRRRFVLDVSDRDRRLFHATPIPTIVLDRLGMIVEANAAASAKLGRGACRDLVGRPFAVVAGMRDPEPLMRHLSRCSVAAGGVTAGATPRPGATPHPAAATTTELELTAANGEPWFVAAVSVGDPGAGGAVTSLIDRGEARLREERAAMIAHELRQSLNTIAIHDQLAAPSRAGEPRGTARVRSAVQAMMRMVDDLLDISLLEAGRLPLHREPVVMTELIESVIERFGGVAQHRRVRVNAERDVPAIAIDRVRIEQVVSNLLSNALKYGDAGSEVAIAISRAPGDTAGVEVAVTSCGPTIPADQLGSLFDRFYRTPAAERGDRAGLGLGLTIARGIVEAHGGTIRATSADGQTVLRFFLPA